MYEIDKYLCRGTRNIDIVHDLMHSTRRNLSNQRVSSVFFQNGPLDDLPFYYFFQSFVRSSIETRLEISAIHQRGSFPLRRSQFTSLLQRSTIISQGASCDLIASFDLIEQQSDKRRQETTYRNEDRVRSAS